MAFERSLASKVKRLAKKVRGRLGQSGVGKLVGKTQKSIKKGVRDVEAGVAKSGRKIAKSKVVKSAQSVTRGLKSAEARVTRGTVQATEEMAKSKFGKRISNYVRSTRMLALAIGSSAGRAAASAARVIVPAPIRAFLTKIYQRLIKFVSRFGSFVVQWFKTRHYKELLAAIPAVLLAVPLLYCAVRIPIYDANKKSVYYRRIAQTALTNQEYEKADLYFKKLQQLGGLNATTSFMNAIGLFEKGDEDGAIEIMEQLAPITENNEPGFVYAHIWLAQLYAGKGDDELVALANQHVDLALLRDPSNTDARTVRAMLRKDKGQWELAIQELEEVVVQTPNRGLALAEMYQQQGRFEEANETIQRIDDYYAEKYGQAIEDQLKIESMSVTDVLIWARAKELLGDRDAAQTLFRIGSENFEEDEFMRRTAADYFLTLSRISAVEGIRSTDTRQLDYIVHAVRVDPTDSKLLAELSLLCKDMNLSAQANGAVKKILQEESPPPLLWSVYGTTLAEKGKYEEAVPYLERGVQENPDHALTLNNTVWVKMQLDHDVEPLVQLINRAIKLEPENPTFLETRGQLMLRAKRWQKAADDLEVALNGISYPNPDIHKGLAVAYQNLQQADLAAAHRKIADRLLNR